MVGDIHTDLLLQGINAKPTEFLETIKPAAHEDRCPTKDEEYRDELSSKQTKVSGTASPLVEPTNVLVGPESSLEALGVCEQAGGNDSPSATDHMNGDGIHSIVDAQFDEQVRSQQIKPTSKYTNNNGSPRIHSGTSRGDSNKTRQTSIHGVCHVKRRNTGFSVVQKCGSEHCTKSSSACCQGRINSNQSGNISSILRSDGKSRTRVEPVPAKPETESTQHLQRCGVSSELGRFIKELTVLVVKATDSGAKNDGGDESCNTSSHVDRTGSSQIDDTDTEKWIDSGI
mmetsp:Transcript_13130/g.21772  ORF Transcript_13130/g.21772 Transcript_13130/m.21772 type:complete len:286 (-) Transcript_13130:728-1585(-)